MGQPYNVKNASLPSLKLEVFIEKTCLHKREKHHMASSSADIASETLSLTGYGRHLNTPGKKYSIHPSQYTVLLEMGVNIFLDIL